MSYDGKLQHYEDNEINYMRDKGDSNVGFVLNKQQRTLTDEEKMDFIAYRKELDGKRDRYESVVKLSRDLIIECKRIIFLMHRITVMATPSMKKKLLDEANCRLTAARNKFLLQIAKALDGSDHYLYLKSYDWALEEFIEACAFYKFLVSRELLLYDEVVSKLQFNDCAETSTQNLYLTLPEVTYLMGLFDIGGELMRFAISEASSGDYQIVQEVTNYLRSLHECYQYLGNVPQNADWAKKSSVFRTSLVKVENALYKWKIREADVSIKA